MHKDNSRSVMDGEGIPRCKICNGSVYEQNHKNTLHHIFHFKKWGYNNYRPALVRDRHGIVLEIKKEMINNFQFSFDDVKSRGKYVTKVTPEQLYLHQNSIKYNCCIKNNRKDPILVTNINLLHPYKYFDIGLSHEFKENTFLKLLPGANYSFKVSFSTTVLTNASYKIPLSCDFQTLDDNTFTFSIVRTFLTIVDDRHNENKNKMKSPFTSKPWIDVKLILPTTKEMPYVERYPIPPKYLKLLQYGLKEFKNISQIDRQNLRELSNLVMHFGNNNYNRFWHIILWMEEVAQGLMLLKFNMEGVTMQIINDEILVVEVPGLAERRPSVVLGDYILIRIQGDHTAYKGLVTKLNDQTVEISHVDEDLLDYMRSDSNIPVDVAFVLGRLSFERMHQAVDTVVNNGIVSLLFPENVPNTQSNTTYIVRDQDFVNQTIVHNAEQKNAVIRILNSTQTLPYIVFGPPGTGKTVTIVEAILQIKKHTQKRILVCAPANSACDMLALKLMPHCTKKQLLRIQSQTRDRTTIPEKLKEYSNIDEDGFKQVLVDELRSYRIIVTTTILIGRYMGSYKPDCVFVDEAAQASEPETNITLALLNIGKQVVLAGDPKQLGPMATACSAKYGLGISLLERLMEYEVYKLHPTTGMYNNNFITMLRLNFRSHPLILSIPNELFYDNKLKPVSLESERDPIVDIAIYPNKQNTDKIRGAAVEFYSVSAKEKREGSSPSYFNLSESKMVGTYVAALLSLNLPKAYKVRPDQIGIVTPYKRQVHKIKENLKCRGYEDIEVGTTEAFQGREKRIIIISTVRAQHALLLHDRKYNLGFVNHDQRFNVAVTRAISKLIVIGCPLVLKVDKKWEMYIDLCKGNETYFGNELQTYFGNDPESKTFKRDVVDRMRHFVEQDGQYHH